MRDDRNAQANGNSANGTYVPQNILITGGAGFIASHVAIRLVRGYGHYKVREIVVTFSLRAL